MRIFITFVLVVVCTVAVNGRNYGTKYQSDESEDSHDYPVYKTTYRPNWSSESDQPLRQKGGPNPSPTFGFDLLNSARRHATEFGQEAGNRIIKVVSGVQEALGNGENKNNNNYDDYDQNTSKWSNGNNNGNKPARGYYGNQQQNQEDRTQQNNRGNQQNEQDDDVYYLANSTPDRAQNSRQNNGSDNDQNNGSDNDQNNGQHQRQQYNVRSHQYYYNY